MKFEYKLYITRKDYKYDGIVRSLKDLFKDSTDSYNLTIINIVDNPEIAEKENILATPLLVRVFPEPQRRFVGDLSKSKDYLLKVGVL
jgi:circadian clock protein KaiB